MAEKKDSRLKAAGVSGFNKPKKFLVLIDLIKNSGQIKPIKELIKSYFEKSDEFKNIADITMLSNIQNASTDDISKIIEKAEVTIDSKILKSSAQRNPSTAILDIK